MQIFILTSEVAASTGLEIIDLLALRFDYTLLSAQVNFRFVTLNVSNSHFDRCTTFTIPCYPGCWLGKPI